jgi:multidrug resistance protein, MATE family
MRLALPLIASEMIYALSGFFATIFVAHLGKDQLAANALVWGVYITVIVFFLGVYNAVSILVAQSYGAEDPHGVGTSFRQGMILAVLFAVPMMLIMWFTPFILNITGQDPAVIHFAKPYFYSLIWSMLPFSILFVMEQFLLGVSKTKMVMWMSILQVPIQIFFYYAFLFGKFGLPKVGLVGIGYGMAISLSIAAIYFGCYLYFSKQFKIYNLFDKWWRVNRKFLLEIIRVGLPLGGIYFIEVALFATIAFMMGYLGTTVLAAYQISYQFLMIGLTFIFAMSQSTSVRVGHEVGRNNREALKLATFVNIGITVTFMLLFTAIYISFPQTIISLDINVHASKLQPIVKEAEIFLTIICFLLLSDSIRIISLGALRGMKDTRFPMFVSIFGFWCVAFPCAYIFAFKLNFGGAGIWWGMVIGLFTAGIILLVRFCRMVGKVDLKAMVTRETV